MSVLWLNLSWDLGLICLWLMNMSLFPLWEKSNCQAVTLKVLNSGSYFAKKHVYEHTNLSVPKMLTACRSKVSVAFWACAGCVQLPGTCELFLNLNYHQKNVTFDITMCTCVSCTTMQMYKLLSSKSLYCPPTYICPTDPAGLYFEVPFQKLAIFCIFLSPPGSFQCLLEESLQTMFCICWNRFCVIYELNRNSAALSWHSFMHRFKQKSWTMSAVCLRLLKIRPQMNVGLHWRK